jgi:predicted GIY-YIG superfamily endonuclease
MKTYVYHIHTKGMGLDQGYIGISVDPKSRWSTHRRSNESPVLANAIRKYGSDLIYSILSAHDTVEEALWQEFTLRPFKNIGWNLAKGGGIPPNTGGWNKGIKTSKEVRTKQSKSRLGKYAGENHPRAKLANIYDSDGNCISNGVVISVWAKENGYHQAHLAATATGKLKLHKGIYARYV